MNNKINRIHERALRLVYSDQVTSFDELFKKDRSFPFYHRRNLKVFSRSFSKYHEKSFHLNRNIPYNPTSRSELHCRNTKTIKYGTKTISYLAPKIWCLVPEIIKSSKSLDAFKSKIRQWKPDYPCRLCKTYLQHVGFI